MYNESNNRLAAVEAVLERMAINAERRNAEDERRNADFALKMQDLRESQDRTDKQMAQTDKQLKILTQQVTGISKSNSLFSEDYFLNSFKKDDLNFFGEHFDKIIKGKGTIVNDEYDFVLINGKTVCIVEVKYKARKDDIPQALKKPATFRKNFPEYKNHKIYLAIAALTINETLENECKKQGIAVIKQEGDKVIVYDQNLKIF